MLTQTSLDRYHPLQPTNHLDVHALTWLEFFLAGWERTVLIVSHDRGFLNKVTESFS